MRRIRYLSVGAILAAGAMLAGSQGCGDDDDASIYQGNVTNVTGEVASLPRGETFLARMSEWIVPSATAQGQQCPASTILACVECDDAENFEHTNCAPVSSETCLFEVEIDFLDDFPTCHLFFLDVNDDFEIESTSPRADFVDGTPSGCRGSQTTFNDVTIDFTTGQASSGSINHSDNCNGSPPPTATPTYYYYETASLTQRPSGMLALLMTVGIVGLLIPRRRG